MALTSKRWWLAGLILGAAACNSSEESTPPAGEGGSGPGCAVGSHDDGSGVCVATLGAFYETTPIASARDHHVTWAATRSGGQFIYVAGGALNMNDDVTTIEGAVINEDGSLGGWQALPQHLQAIGPIVASTDARVLFGGGVRPGGVSRASETATINDDGSLGEIVSGPEMNDPRFHGAAVLHDGWVYATGGLDASGTSVATVERIAFDDDGAHGEWILEEEQLLEPRSHHGLALHDGALYVTGGLTRVENDFANDITYTTVLRSEIQEDGSIGPWTEIGTLPSPLAVHSSFVHAGQLYLAHGLDMASSTFTNLFQRATILEDGTLGEWEQLPVTLPFGRGHCHQVPIVNGFLYSVAGTNNLGSQINSFVARFE